MIQIQYLNTDFKACINISIERIATGDLFIMMTN